MSLFPILLLFLSINSYELFDYYVIDDKELFDIQSITNDLSIYNNIIKK